MSMARLAERLRRQASILTDIGEPFSRLEVCGIHMWPCIFTSAIHCVHIHPGDPSIQITPALDSKVYKCYLHCAIWLRRDSHIVLSIRKKAWESESERGD